MKLATIIVVREGSKVSIEQVKPDELEPVQHIIGGYVENLSVPVRRDFNAGFPRGLAILCDEDARIKRRPEYHLPLWPWHRICGTYCIARWADDGSELVSVTNEDIEAFVKLLRGGA